MKLSTLALVGALVSVFSTPIIAEVNLEAGVARSEETWGGEFGMGYSIVSIGNFRVTPAVGAFLYGGDNDRYYMDNNGGNPRCRDSETGRYAASEKCDNLALKAFGRVEMTYTTRTSIMLGVGGRYFVGRLRPFGTMSVALTPTISLKANGGSDYLSASFVARF